MFLRRLLFSSKTSNLSTINLTGLVVGGGSLMYMRTRSYPRHSTPAPYNPAIFSMSNQNSDDKKYCKKQRLEEVKNYILDEVPLILNKTLMYIPEEFFDENVIIEYENNFGDSSFFHGRKYLTFLLMASRIYYSAKSYAKVIKVLNIRANDEEDCVSAGLRIVLYPFPTTSEKRLDDLELFKILEERSEWIDLRINVYLSDLGLIKRLKISKIVPSNRTGLRASLRELKLKLAKKNGKMPEPV